MNSMKQLNEQEIKEISLDILNFITNKCDEMNLKYVLVWGTLIGAVRHNGFIPWDDDIDIAMPRKDYEILIEYMTSNDNQPYSLVSVYNENNYNYLVSRVVNTKTFIKLECKSNLNRMEHGVFVDIYPIDKCGVSMDDAFTFFKKQMHLETLRTMALSQSFVKAKTSWLKTVVKYPVYVYAKIRGSKYFLSHLEKNARNANNKEGEFYCCWCGTGGMDYHKLIFDRNIFENVLKCKFEDNEYFIPQEYDYVLTKVYGEYMKLPPEMDRIGHHFYKAYYLQ